MSRSLVTKIVTLVLMAATAYGHGIPLIVNVVDGKLVASNGIPDANGFAHMIFMDGNPDSQMDHAPSPVFGPVAVTDLPGFDIFDMAPNSGLFLAPLARPVLDANPATDRLLWFCNAAGQVGLAGHGEDLTIVSDFDEITLPQSAAPVPPSLQVAAPSSQNLGNHVHYLDYLVDDSGPAAIGAYGFFARLTSPNYGLSDPLLVVLNNGLEEADLVAAGFAMNAAAIDPEPIPGDYDGDREVNVDDYNFWRARFANTVAPFTSPDGNGNGTVDAADYVVWRNAVTPARGGAVRIASIPEPAGLAIAAIGAVILVVRRRPRMSVPATPHHPQFRANPCPAALA